MSGLRLVQTDTWAGTVLPPGLFAPERITDQPLANWGPMCVHLTNDEQLALPRSRLQANVYQPGRFGHSPADYHF